MITPLTGSGSVPFRDLGRQLSNWGRWGESDTLGTLNLINAHARVAAAGLVHSGRTVALGLDLGHGPQNGESGRINPLHVMTRTGATVPTASGYLYTDDLLLLSPQGSTQIDALAHVSYDGQIYNGHPVASVTAAGARLLGMESMRTGIQNRGVLLDLARHWGVDMLPERQAVSRHDLDACAEQQGVQVFPGDTLLVRTGWIKTFLDDGNGARYLASEPGLDLTCAAWLKERDVAFLGSDNFGVEVVPAVDPCEDFPLHCVLVRDMGMPLGEMFDLEDLAKACFIEGRWDFLFTCLPLPISGGVGSPVMPLATF